MKGRTPTKSEKEYWSRLCSEVGCIACRIDGRFNNHCLPHHVDGRTQPGCHKLVLPLCGEHHQQDDSDQLERVAVHPNKAEFERIYGAQDTLILMCHDILGIS